MRRKKRNNKMFVMFLIFVFSISIGYAFLNTLLLISGTIDVKGNTWNVYYDNVSVKGGSVTDSTAPTGGDIASGINYVCSLMYPGEFYEFTVDIHNEGTVDAVIDNIDIAPKLYDTQKDYINYTVEYQNGEQLAKNQLIKKGEFVRVKVRIEYRLDYTGSQSWFEDISGSIKIYYVPDRGNGVVVEDNGIKAIPIADGSLDVIGTIVTIGTEKFYTIGTNGDNVRLLAMYNLYVGGSYDNSTSTWTAYGDEATGMQDANMKGYVSGQSIYQGVTPYSSDEQKGTEYHTFEGSIAQIYVNNYKTKLEEINKIEIISARLIGAGDIVQNFSCTKPDNIIRYYCNDSPYPWIYSTSYWTENMINPNILWNMKTDGVFSYTNYANNSYFGIRPVIEIAKSEIDIKIPTIGSIEDIGSIVTFGTEKFYTIGTEGNNVKLLSMYNLHVGNQYDDENGLVPLINPTGKQSEIARGRFSGYSATNPIIGVTAFSNVDSTYEGSIVEGYVNNYKIILENDYDVDIVEARLITKDELISEEIGCSAQSNTCINAPSFIYLTAYWSGSADAASFVWIVESDGFFNSCDYGSGFSFGVRPVIIISKYYFN